VAYREGRSDIFRILDAERALAEARAGLAEAYLAWGVAQADLLNAMGEDLP
jgi:outer membrane protein TolC